MKFVVGQYSNLFFDHVTPAAMSSMKYSVFVSLSILVLVLTISHGRKERAGQFAIGLCGVNNSSLLGENQQLRERVEILERKVDQAEQYSRRNCLRISGVKEHPFESTDDIVLKMAADIESEVQLSDIDRSHRVGNPKTPRSKPRDIIVKFATYRSRRSFYKQRKRHWPSRRVCQLRLDKI